MDPIDLNLPPDDGDPDGHDHGRKSGPVEAVFRNHRARLLGLFEEAREEDLACMGAVAWLTDPFVLRAMATVPTAIVTQKEDYLRPDGPGAGTKSWQADLRELYDAIADSGWLAADWPVPFERLYMPPPLCDLEYGEEHPMAGVRCCGVRNNRDPKSRVYSPLMHNKFLIFARAVDQTGRGSAAEESTLDPHWRVEAVWTGSYNLSRLSPRSRENAVVVRDPVIGDAYLREWAGIMAMSERLDWESEWVAPEWRKGT